MKKICHLTSVHPRWDTRIYIKELKSIAQAGYDTSIVSADGEGDEITPDGIKIYDVGKPTNRKERFLKTRNLVYNKALALNADLYHFHDPELLPIGVKLKKAGKIVIYDVHEDVPRDILSKYYIPKRLRKAISFVAESIEDRFSKQMSYIFTATPHIKKRFQKFLNIVEDINNYSMVGEFISNVEWKDRNNETCYIGAITEVRGIYEMIKVSAVTEKKMNLAGRFVSEELFEDVKALLGWKYVNFWGYADRKLAKDILQRSKVGLVILHPTISFLDSFPLKLAEYMTAGIPVVASNFPLWKEIVEGNNCGICVNPLKPKEIAEAVNYLLTHDQEAEQMGKNGQQAVIEKYNWKQEEQKLLQVYRQLLNK